MINPMSLSDRLVLVTGASSGIGRACARLASQLGASVVLTGRSRERLEAVEGELEGTGHLVVPADLELPGVVEKLFAAVSSEDRVLHGLVHAAGFCPAVPLQAVTHTQVQRVMTTNYWSFLELVKCFVKRKHSLGGSVVAVSSVSSLAGWAGGSIYCGSKGALDAAIRALAIELVPKRIRVNSVVPSNINTPLFQEIAAFGGEEAVRQIEAKQPLGIGDPLDVAHAVMFLLSDAARFITGSHLVVDGGYLAQ